MPCPASGALGGIWWAPRALGTSSSPALLPIAYTPCVLGQLSFVPATLHCRYPKVLASQHCVSVGVSIASYHRLWRTSLQGIWLCCILPGSKFRELWCVWASLTLTLIFCMPSKPSSGWCYHVLPIPDVVWLLFSCSSLLTNAPILSTHSFICLHLPYLAKMHIFIFSLLINREEVVITEAVERVRESCFNRHILSWISEKIEVLHPLVSLGRHPVPRVSHQEGPHLWEQRGLLTFITFHRGNTWLKGIRNLT